MANRPNIFIIVLDSVRQDHTSLSGHLRDTTPNLKQLADRPEGEAFSQCISHGNCTSKTTATILTGKYPGVHRFLYEDSRLRRRIRTVAERFKAAGYETSGISSNAFVSEETGFGRGFDDLSVVPKNLENSFTQMGSN